jgi:outer membrane immunogenic protein
MSKTLIGIAAAAALAGTPALAADMPLKAPPPPAAVFSWTGFYVGGNIGYSWGDAHDDFSASVPFSGATSTACTPVGPVVCAAASDSNHLDGAIGGLQAGYNWQYERYLAGIESDFQFSGQRQRGSNTVTAYSQVGGIGAAGPFNPDTVTYNNSDSLNWLGTLRGRLGITTDRWLVYGTGGLAYGEVKVVGSAGATGVPITGSVGSCVTASGCPSQPFGAWSNSQIPVGWTAGFGVERVLGDDHWSVKLEYLYVDLGSVHTTFATQALCFGNGNVGGAGCGNLSPGSGTFSTRVIDNIVRLGANYRF